MDAAREAKAVTIVEDDESMRSALQGLMRAAGLRARAFSSAEEFLDSGEIADAACLVADIRLPGISGLDLQRLLAARKQTIPIIFITAHGDDTIRAQAMQAGAAGFLSKPFDDGALLDGIRAATER
ncbi:MAG TPA: response regulator [Acidobacteriaceae bacterium]|nr:response regulator [Acidobacteriaceae bacterium]